MVVKQIQNHPNAVQSEQYEIKVAVIDDGIDAAEASMHKSLKKGTNWCTQPGSSDSSISWYVVPDAHGTLMATLIRQVCPNVKLYVARLDEATSPHGKRQVTAASAAKVCSMITHHVPKPLIKNRAGYRLGT